MNKHGLQTPDWQPVVTLEHGRGAAAVCRDPDGSLWLVWDLAHLADALEVDDEPLGEDDSWDLRDDFGDELVGYETAGAATTVDGIAAIAGRLPDGAVTVEVRDASGRAPVVAREGVWLAVPDPSVRMEPLVRFFAADGSPVRRPLPGHVAVSPLPRAEEPCPACGGRAWELATAAGIEAEKDEQRFSSWLEPGDRAAICETCGYAQHLGGEPVVIEVRQPRTKLTPEDQRTRRDAYYADLWRRATAGIGVPPAGLARDWSGERRIAGWSGGRHDEPIYSISLDHGTGSSDCDGPWISVTTSVDEMDDDLIPPAEWVADRLVAVLSDQWRSPHSSSGPEAALRGDLRRREVEARAHALDQRDIHIPLNGELVSFLTVGDDEAWSAFARHNGITITIMGRRFAQADAALESTDAAQYLP